MMMDTTTFDKFREIAYAQGGIAIKEHKTAMVSARVNKRMRALGYEAAGEYLQYLVADESGNELVQFLDCITTNLTSFFREKHHFEFLRDVIPRWEKQGQRRFRLWSAACSTGEEPYSIAMTLFDALRGNHCDTKILATDLSTRVLATAKGGVYTRDRLKDMSPHVRSRHTDPVRVNGDECFMMNDRMKEMVVFRRMNLSTPPFPMRGPFDVVFCRNVMIYFDPVVRKRLIDEIHSLLRPGGYLMVGHAESLAGIEHSFKGVRPSIYRKD